MNGKWLFALGLLALGSAPVPVAPGPLGLFLLAAPAGPPQPSVVVAALLGQGLQARQSAHFDESLRLYREALAQARALSDKAGEAYALRDTGGVYRVTGEPQKALAFFSQSLPLFTAVGDKEGEADALNSMGLVSAGIGQPQKALEFYNRSLPLTAVGDKAGEAITLSNIGAVYRDIGQPQKALEFFSQSLPLFTAVGDKGEEADALNDIGAIYRDIGRPRKALEFFSQSLPLRRAVGDKGREADALNDIGTAYADIGQPQKALEFYNQTLPLHRAVGDKAGEAKALNNMGLVYADIGQPQKALAFLSQSLPLFTAVGDKTDEAITLNNIGTVYRDIGQPQKAVEFYNQSLPLHRAVGDKAGEAKALNNMGLVYADISQPRKALEFYHQSLPLLTAAGDKRAKALTLNNIGLVYAGNGQPQKALEFYNQSLPLHRAVGDKAEEAKTLSNIGAVYAGIGQPRRALEFYNHSLPLCRAVQARQVEAITLAYMASLEESRGRLVNASNHLHQALTLLEATRQNLGGLSDAKVRFLASTLFHYDHYVHLLLQQHEPAAAFEWAEKSKARALLDLVAAGKVDLNRGASPEEQQRQQELQRRLSQLNQQWVAAGLQPAPDAGRLTALQQQMGQAESALQTFTDLLDARHPELARQRAARTVTLADVARFLPADTMLLDYVALRYGDANKVIVDQMVLFCVTQHNGKPFVAAYPIAQPQDELAEKVEDFRASCADPRRKYRSKARVLYSLLLAPAAKQLAAKKRLIVCPDGPLWGLPFQALIPSSSPAGAPAFLAQRYEIDYAYSATAAQAARLARTDPRRPRPSGTLLVFANPAFGETPPSAALSPGARPLLADARPLLADARPLLADARDPFLQSDGRIRPLPGTQVEAEALKTAFPEAVLYTGSRAQKVTAQQESGKYRYLHFATHGLLYDTAPLMSAVVLAQPPPGSEEDQFLTAREIFDWTLSAELVVLSACNTARGGEQAGEGVVGLTWALFVAGAPTQVVSQWAVADASTAELMKQFYTRLKQGQSKGAALRGAELALLADGEHQHPYYWAPFVLLGDWR